MDTTYNCRAKFQVSTFTQPGQSTSCFFRVPQYWSRFQFIIIQFCIEGFQGNVTPSWVFFPQIFLPSPPFILLQKICLFEGEKLHFCQAFMGFIQKKRNLCVVEKNSVFHGRRRRQRRVNNNKRPLSGVQLFGVDTAGP